MGEEERKYPPGHRHRDADDVDRGCDRMERFCGRFRHCRDDFCCEEKERRGEAACVGGFGLFRDVSWRVSVMDCREC